MLEKYRHISFDLDGTLVWTLPEYRYSLLPRIIQKCSGELCEPALYDKFWFEASRANVVKEHFKVEPLQFWETFRIEDNPYERDKFTAVFDDVAPAFQKLKEKGKLISIITDAPLWIAEMEIKKIREVSPDYFLPLSFNDFPNKPDPLGFRHVLQKLDVLPEETLYIGNSRGDAEFAKNTGVDFVYIDREEYQHETTDPVFHRISSLIDLFQF